MKNKTNPEAFESTYALLVRSEEKERGAFEAVTYLLFILCAVFTISQVAQQPVVIPTSIVTHDNLVTQHANTQDRGV